MRDVWYAIIIVSAILILGTLIALLGLSVMIGYIIGYLMCVATVAYFEEEDNE